MNVRAMIMRFWDLSGHQSDLYPFTSDDQISADIDITAPGTQYFLSLISQGQVALANWKKADQRFIRFRNFYISKNIQLGVDEDVYFDVVRQSLTSMTIDPTQTGFTFDLDAITNSIMVVESSRYKVMDVTEVSPTSWSLTVYPELPDADDDDDDDIPDYPDTIEVQFALNEFRVDNLGVNTYSWLLSLPERVYSILRIDDYVGNNEIRQSNNKVDLNSLAEANNIGTPVEYLNLGNKIVFDTGLLEKRWYKFEVFQQPADVVTLDQVVEIPEPFHQALIYWGQWQIALRERQEIHATNYRRLLDKELLSVRDEYDNDFERSKTNGFKVRRD